MTKDIGIHNNLFGGILLSWLDTAGAIYASELCENTHVVTAYIADVSFNEPTKQGDIIYIYGDVIKFGNSSVTIKLKAVRKNVYNTNEDTVCETQMVFVQIDDNNKPSIITSKRKKEFNNNVQT